MVTLILFAVVAAAVVIPTIHTGTTQSQKSGWYRTHPARGPNCRVWPKSVGFPCISSTSPIWRRRRAALNAGQLDMVVDGTRRDLGSDPISDTDTSAGASYVRAVSDTLGAQQAFAQAGLTPGQAAIVATAKPLPVQSIHAGKKTRTTSEATALIGVILIFIVLTQYLTWTLMGVMEEKASRVVEVLLATVRPIQLLAGKVIGIGVVAMAQAIALGGLRADTGESCGFGLGSGAAPLVLASHACLAGPRLCLLQLDVRCRRFAGGASGPSAEPRATTQRASPLWIHRLAHRSQLGQCLAVGEGAGLHTAHRPFAMPTLVGFGEAPGGSSYLFGDSDVVCTLLVALVAARVYRTAVLRTGGRVRLATLPDCGQ